MKISRVTLLAALALASTAAAAAPAAGTAATTATTAKASSIDLAVDARDAGRGILHAHETLPAHAGEMDLVYPQWIPGEHGPTATIGHLGGLRIRGNGQPLRWRRDSADMHRITVTVPAGVSRITVDMEVLGGAAGSYTAGASSTPNLLDLSWNQLVFYPRGARAAAVAITPHLTLPQGWSYATALSPSTGVANGTLDFAPTTLETLVDSPVISGKYLASFDLGTVRGVPHAVSIVGDAPEDIAAPPELVAKWKRLVVEANALFGARHYGAYRFLLTVSDHVDWFGLEHHQSSDDRLPARALIDKSMADVATDLLPHEFAHSWNGKYRRPRGLATPDYQQPMRGDLLWVYEGLTDYLGWVLAGRSGLASLDVERAELARSVAKMDIPGRTWRPLIDTAVGAQLEAADGLGNSTLRRGTDYYDEGRLIWLEADVIIRRETGGARSLDDFCQRFHGGKDGAPAVHPYDLAEVIRTLNEVAPYAWKAFLDARIYQIAPQVPLGGVEGGGYKVAFSDEKPALETGYEKAFKFTSYADSLGLGLGKESTVRGVLAGGPADKAGVTAGMKLVAVDGRKTSSDVIDAALERASKDRAPIELIVESEDLYRTLAVDWHGGARWRVLERDASKPDVVEKIVAPKISPPQKP